MAIFEETAFAKVNLALHVRRKRDDGYHEIDTFFAFAEHGDHLTAEPADALSLSISGEFSGNLDAGEDNLVMRAARLLQQHFGVSAGAKLHLVKSLPVASGIGGGSADAAAAVRLLARLWEIDAEIGVLADLIAPLGADIPACVASKTVRGQGTGIELHAVYGSSIAGKPMLLVNPREPVATGSIFARWDGVDRGALGDGDVEAAMMTGRNDLQAPAIALCPAIDEVLALLNTMTPVLARMSGSGATCFALFDSETTRDAAQAHITAARSDWWTMASKLR